MSDVPIEHLLDWQPASTRRDRSQCVTAHARHTPNVAVHMKPSDTGLISIAYPTPTVIPQHPKLKPTASHHAVDDHAAALTSHHAYTIVKGLPTSHLVSRHQSRRSPHAENESCQWLTAHFRATWRLDLRPVSASD